MSNKFTSKIALYFQVPVQDLSNAKEVKAAKDALVQMFKDYAVAVEKDPNVLIADMVFIMSPEDYAKRGDEPINVHLAELMAARTEALAKKPAKKADEPKDSKPVPDKVIAKPAKKAPEPEPEQDEDERPAVQAVDWRALKDKAEEQVAIEPTSKIKVTQPVAVADDDSKFIVDKVFEDLKRTEKSEKIITALVKAGGEIDFPDLIKATKLTSGDLSSWFSATGKRLKFIENTGKGKYKLNPDKV
jgi:hypothetical protein